MPIYQPASPLREMTWRDWKRKGGCSLCNWAERYTFDALGRDWRKCTIGEISDASALAGREIARFAYERFGMQVYEEYPDPTGRRAPHRNPEPLPLVTPNG